MLLFCYETILSILYNENDNKFEFHKIRILSNITSISYYAYVHIDDFVLFFGGWNGILDNFGPDHDLIPNENISNKIYKYTISEERCVTLDQALPIPLSCCVATLNEDNQSVHISGGYYDNALVSAHIKMKIKEMIKTDKEKEIQKIAKEQEKIIIEQMKKLDSSTLIKALNRKKKEIKKILEYWIRSLSIKIGWIHDFNIITSKYILLRYFQFVKEINCKGDRLHMVQFSPDGQKFVTASRSKIIRIWDVNSGKIVKQLKGHSNHTDQVLFSPDGTMILSCLFDNTICLWNVESGIEIKKLEVHADNIDTAHFSPDGTIIAFFSSGTTNIWDLQSGQVRLLSDVRSTFGAFSPNGQQIVLFTWDNS
ncbi:WD-40 repeat-containing protein, partial [Reticulomyxa filosa]